MRGYVPSDVISDSLFLIEFNGKKGIADLNGEIIIEPEYDGITNYSDKDIILIKDQKFGNFNIETENNLSHIADYLKVLVIITKVLKTNMVF